MERFSSKMLVRTLLAGAALGGAVTSACRDKVEPLFPDISDAVYEGIHTSQYGFATRIVTERGAADIFSNTPPLPDAPPMANARNSFSGTELSKATIFETSSLCKPASTVTDPIDQKIVREEVCGNQVVATRREFSTRKDSKSPYRGCIDRRRERTQTICRPAA